MIIKDISCRTQEHMNHECRFDCIMRPRARTTASIKMHNWSGSKIDSLLCHDSLVMVSFEFLNP